MNTRTLEELYWVMLQRGGLTRVIEDERMVSFMRATADVEEVSKVDASAATVRPGGTVRPGRAA